MNYYYYYSRDCAQIAYLSLELGIEVPLSSLLRHSPDFSLKCIDERLRDIEHSLGVNSPTSHAGDLGFRASLAYGYYTGRFYRHVPIKFDASEIERLSSPPNCESQTEACAFLDALKDLVERTRRIGRRLSDCMPSYLDWKYLDDWRDHLESVTIRECSTPPPNVNRSAWEDSPTSTVFTDIDEALKLTPRDSDQDSEENSAGE